ELLGVEVAGAFIEHGGQEIREALFAFRVLRVAAVEGVAQRDQRHAVLLHQPRRDAAGTLDLLDLHGLCLAEWDEKRGRKQAREEAGFKTQADRSRPEPETGQGGLPYLGLLRRGGPGAVPPPPAGGRGPAGRPPGGG